MGPIVASAMLVSIPGQDLLALPPPWHDNIPWNIQPNNQKSI